MGAVVKERIDRWFRGGGMNTRSAAVILFTMVHPSTHRICTVKTTGMLHAEMTGIMQTIVVGIVTWHRMI
jgi:hypothetical protein